MDLQLTPYQARIIGCLLEKEVTTPDAYPLSVNSLVAACNQKSNREPVLSLSERDVINTLAELETLRLVMEETGARTSRYRQRFCNTAFGGLQFTDQERAVVGILLLRGPQTPGELRARSNRWCSFDNVSETEQVLQQLIERELVMQLPREAGKRESRFAHLLGEQTAESLSTATDNFDQVLTLQQEISQLRAENARLKAELEVLRAR